MFNNHETRETSHGTLQTCIPHQGSKITKLINKFTNSPINLLQRARKYNKNMQNKAKLMDAQMSVTALLTRGYESFRPFSRPKNKAKQTQNKAKLQNAIMNVTSFLTKEYENLLTFCQAENKPKTKPKQTQTNPILLIYLIKLMFYRLLFKLRGGRQ
ncbi:hypothetical protein ES703_105457 [subsurface metagenome]